MSKAIAGGRYITAAGVFVDANGVAIVSADTSPPDLQLQYDDLSLIRGISTKRQNELGAMGIGTFEQLASADAAKLDRDMEVSIRTIKGWIKKANELQNDGE